MNEIWKDIKDYEGFYQVSNTGKVKSLERSFYAWNNTKNDYTLQKRKGKLLKQSLRNNYLSVSLGKERKSYAVHRLVLEAFVENESNKKTVNHKDGNKKNNNLSNLEWATHKENMIHSFEHKLRENSYLERKVIMYDLFDNELKSFDSLTKAGLFIGEEKYKKHICDVCMGKRKTAYGYKWQYAN